MANDLAETDRPPCPWAAARALEIAVNVGDIIRLRHGPACGDVLGLMANQVGVVRTIDATWDRTALLISFPDVDLYTSALREDDFEVIQPGATHPVSATASKTRDTA